MNGPRGRVGSFALRGAFGANPRTARPHRERTSVAVGSKMTEIAMSFDRTTLCRSARKEYRKKGPRSDPVSVFPELLRIRFASLRGVSEVPETRCGVRVSASFAHLSVARSRPPRTDGRRFARRRTGPFAIRAVGDSPIPDSCVPLPPLQPANRSKQPHSPLVETHPDLASRPTWASSLDEPRSAALDEVAGGRSDVREVG